MFVAVAEDVFIWSVAAQRKVDSFNCTLEMLLLTYLIDWLTTGAACLNFDLRLWIS